MRGYGYKLPSLGPCPAVPSGHMLSVINRQSSRPAWISISSHPYTPPIPLSPFNPPTTRLGLVDFYAAQVIHQAHAYT